MNLTVVVAFCSLFTPIQEDVDVFACEADLVLDNPDPHPPSLCEVQGEGPGHAAAPLAPCQTSDHFGSAMAMGGDGNGDGLPDLLVGGTAKPSAPATSTQAWLFPGPGTAPVLAIDGNGRSDLLGASVAFVPDLDGDGLDELAVGAPRWSAVDAPARRVGRVYLFFGRPLGAGGGPRLPASGAADVVLEGDVDGGMFGSALAAGDVDGDGVVDLAVGAPGSDAADPSGYPGAAWVFLGTKLLAAGSTSSPTVPRVADLWPGDADVVVSGHGPGDRLGHALAVMGDVDHVPGDELIVGAPQLRGDLETGFGAVGAGYVRLLSRTGATPAPDFVGSQVRVDSAGHVLDGEGFGWSVAGGADLDGDGVGDVAIGALRYTAAPGAASEAPLVGRVRVFSGRTRRALLASPGGATWLAGAVAGGKLGASVALGDVTGDGRPEVVVGAFGEAVGLALCPGGSPAMQGGPAAGAVHVFDGRSGARLHRIRGEAPRDRLGWALAAGDLDGDGLAEVLSGGMAWTDPLDVGVNTKQEVGRVYLFTGASLRERTSASGRVEAVIVGGWKGSF